MQVAYSRMPTQWDDLFTPKVIPLPEITLGPGAIMAMAATVVVLKNPKVSRRGLFSWFRSDMNQPGEHVKEGYDGVEENDGSDQDDDQDVNDGQEGLCDREQRRELQPSPVDKATDQKDDDKLDDEVRHRGGLQRHKRNQ